MNINDITIDTNVKEVSKKDSQIPLRKKEYQLLEYLVMNKELQTWNDRNVDGCPVAISCN